MKEMTAFRGELVALVERLLCGPLADGELLSSPPGDTYLTGILWPRGVGAEAVDDDDIAQGDSGEAPSDAGVPGYRAMKPCSVGLTFTVPIHADVTVSLGSTARYELADARHDGPRDPDAHGAASGPLTAAAATWRHRKLMYVLNVVGSQGSSEWLTSAFKLPDGSDVVDPGVKIHVRRRVHQGAATITVTLINSAQEEEEFALRDRACLFQAQLVAGAADSDGTVGIVPRKQIIFDSGDADAYSNDLIYREAREYAVGHGIAAEWPASEGPGVAWVRTAWLPSHFVTGTDPGGHPRLSKVGSEHPSMLKAASLAAGGREEVTRALRALVTCYQDWIRTDVEDRLVTFTGHLRTAAQGNLDRCREAARRMTEGVDMLEGNDAAWRAFQLANEAMDAQARFASKGDRAGPLKWRPFQLAYILMAVPSLVAPDREDRSCMDLLWFPTGGGKTEAYLGLTAFQIFFRRITSEVARQTSSVDVLMRYTLRLLTVQQFQRAAALICSCELRRQEHPDELGNTPISIGLYVGKDTTPNRMSDAREALAREAAGESPKSTPRQLLACPVCGSPLGRQQYTASPTQPRLDIRCSFEGCGMAGQALPVLTVDECIYSHPPSLLLGTVDKFAQLPRREDIGGLFGPNGLPPGLIIQDELHLISGPLGSLTGLYEAAIDILCTRDGVRPKVIGSTATIGRAESQVRALFDRTVFQFPPPGIDAGDSFFAVKLAVEGQDRLYVGVPSAGRSPKFALQATLAALLEGTKQLQGPATDAEVVDPYWTCVTYFNSLRELGGAHVMVQDDVPRQMTFLANRLGTGQRRAMEKNPVAELSSRVASRDIPTMLQRLEARLGADPLGEQPEDVVLASNMISVGVDVPRLGLMVVNGQPKSTSEYIQATSRVGRGLPGLVVTLYNFGRPRDLSHFEHFKVYHSALYRGVEATSVTPWAPRARDKALRAVFIGVVRHGVPGMSADDAAARLQPNDPRVTAIRNELVRRCSVGSWGLEDAETASELDAIIRTWQARADAGGTLLYWERKFAFGPVAAHLLRSAEDLAAPGSKAWPAPGSMREVEPSAAFRLLPT